MKETNELALLKQKLASLEERKTLLNRLPHRYSHKHYTWSKEFFDSRDKMCLLTAANQIGKSTVQIRKCLEWITNKELWPELWPGKIPRLIWYTYPSREVATQEWHT